MGLGKDLDARLENHPCYRPLSFVGGLVGFSNYGDVANLFIDSKYDKNPHYLSDVIEGLAEKQKEFDGIVAEEREGVVDVELIDSISSIDEANFLVVASEYVIRKYSGFLSDGARTYVDDLEQKALDYLHSQSDGMWRQNHVEDYLNYFIEDGLKPIKRVVSVKGEVAESTVAAAGSPVDNVVDDDFDDLDAMMDFRTPWWKYAVGIAATGALLATALYYLWGGDSNNVVDAVQSPAMIESLPDSSVPDANAEMIPDVELPKLVTPQQVEINPPNYIKPEVKPSAPAQVQVPKPAPKKPTAVKVRHKQRRPTRNAKSKVKPETSTGDSPWDI